MRQEYISIGGVAAALAALGGASVWRHHETRAEVMFATSAALLFGGLLSARFRFYFYSAWTRLAKAIAVLNTTVLLAIVFWLGFGFYRLWERLLGRDPLGRRSGPLESYWIPRQRTRQQAWQFERLY